MEDERKRGLSREGGSDWPLPRERTTWRPQAGQWWYRIDLEPTIGAAWLGALTKAAWDRALCLPLTPSATRDSLGPIPSCSGAVIGISREGWLTTMEWIASLRLRFPESILIGWFVEWTPEMLSFGMESGLSFPCRRIEHLASVARSAVQHASIFPIEPSPAFRGIQSRYQSFLGDRKPGWSSHSGGMLEEPLTHPKQSNRQI